MDERRLRRACLSPPYFTNGGEEVEGWMRTRVVDLATQPSVPPSKGIPRHPSFSSVTDHFVPLFRTAKNL